MSIALPDEYQDGVTAGSLVQARRCWLALVAADTLPQPHRFTFVFHSPSRRMAQGLEEFLRYAEYAGFVRALDRARTPEQRAWRVTGTTRATVWSLSSLEHLFMRLRGAGSRYQSGLETLALLPEAPCRG